jgi:hypothetical protein
MEGEPAVQCQKTVYRPSGDELRMKKMMMVRMQQGGRNFSISHDANEERFYHRENSPWKSNGDNCLNGSSTVDSHRYVKVARSGVFLPGMIPPGRRTDDGDDEIGSSLSSMYGRSDRIIEPSSAQNLLLVESSKICRSNMHDPESNLKPRTCPIEVTITSDREKEPVATSIEDNSAKLTDLFINREITIISEVNSPTHKKRGDKTLSDYQKEKSSSNNKRKYGNKDITIVPEISQTKTDICHKGKVQYSNDLTCNQLDVRKHEFSILPSELQHCHNPKTSSSMENKQCIIPQPQHYHSAFYGNKMSVRSLISMNSFSTAGASANVIIHRAESKGIESMVSCGSTAYELECLATSSLATAMASVSVSGNNRNQISCAAALPPGDDRPNNPIALSLLQHQTSIATHDSRNSRMSVVSQTKSILTSSTFATPPPSMLGSDNFHNLKDDTCVYHHHQHHHHHHHQPLQIHESHYFGSNMTLSQQYPELKCLKQQNSPTPHDKAQRQVEHQHYRNSQPFDWCTSSESSASVVNDMVVWNPTPNAFSPYNPEKKIGRLEF